MTNQRCFVGEHHRFRLKDQFTRHGGHYPACENSCAMAMEAWEGIS